MAVMPGRSSIATVGRSRPVTTTETATGPVGLAISIFNILPIVTLLITRRNSGQVLNEPQVFVEVDRLRVSHMSLK